MGTYKSIVDACRLAANTVNPTGRFIHGRKVQVSQKYDGAYPIIVLYPFTTPRDEDDNDSSNLLMAFLTQASPDNSETQEETLISAMDNLSDSFLANLRKANFINLTGIRKEPIYQIFNGTLSGYALNMNAITKSSEPC